MPRQIAPGKYTYRSEAITDGLHTSLYAPTTITISKSEWHGSPALIAVREGPLITRVSRDSLTVSARDLTLLHFASWYPTQKPIGSIHADFDSSSVTIVMKGRVDSTGTFAFSQASGRLPQFWTNALVVPALPLTPGWRGTLQIAPPIHPHAHRFFTSGWAIMRLGVVGTQRVRVPAGDFDCWKVQVGDASDSSYVWVDLRSHVVVRTQSIYRSVDTKVDDRIELQSATPSLQ